VLSQCSQWSPTWLLSIRLPRYGVVPQVANIWRGRLGRLGRLGRQESLFPFEVFFASSRLEKKFYPRVARRHSVGHTCSGVDTMVLKFLSTNVVKVTAISRTLRYHEIIALRCDVSNGRGFGISSESKSHLVTPWTYSCQASLLLSPFDYDLSMMHQNSLKWLVLGLRLHGKAERGHNLACVPMVRFAWFLVMAHMIWGSLSRHPKRGVQKTHQSRWS
jgi:hypothetical protein